MSPPRNHRLSDWLYHTTAFTRLYGRVAGQFSAAVLWDEFWANFLSEMPENGTLLEIGAGPGLLALKILEHRPSLTIIVTDYSLNMLDLAQANLAKAVKESHELAQRQDQLEYVQADAMDLSKFGDRQIDGIYSMGAVKHFPNPLNCLDQAKNTLANQGILYFADSCADAGWAGTQAITQQLNLSPVASSLLSPIIHLGLKKESPSASEVRAWQTKFGDGSDLKVQFGFSGSMFTLTYRK